MRAIVLVVDGLGIGALPDASTYGDDGANTVLHTCEMYPGHIWKNLSLLGLGNCEMIINGEKKLCGCIPVDNPIASYGTMSELSPGRDTTTGHWEIAGIILDKPFTIFPPEYPSFPKKLINDFERMTGKKIIGNKAASGTEIIDELGEEHVRTGNPICYTAHDSIFQIAAHEKIIPVGELYSMCEIARKICDEYNIPRIIARPFTGKNGKFKRTIRRKDFSISLPYKSVLEILQENQVQVVGIGKIGDLFNEKGIDRSYHDKGNEACINRLYNVLAEKQSIPQFIFINLVDTDMLYGHRRDPKGFFQAVNDFDKKIPEIKELLSKEDLLIITADHGCDPTYIGTDHTREYVPLIVYGINKSIRNLGIRRQFSDIAASLIDFFNLSIDIKGESFLTTGTRG